MDMTSLFVVRCSPDFHDRVQAAAEARGMVVSKVVRGLLDGWLRDAPDDEDFSDWVHSPRARKPTLVGTAILKPPDATQSEALTIPKSDALTQPLLDEWLTEAPEPEVAPGRRDTTRAKTSSRRDADRREVEPRLK